MNQDFSMVPVLSCLLGIGIGIVLGVVAKNPKVENWIGQRFPWNPPPYVTIGSRRKGFCAMALQSNGGIFEYYRDAGCWSLEFKRWMLFWYRVKKYPRTAPQSHLSGEFLHRISQKVWAEDNDGYIGKPYEHAKLVVINVPF
jgi:hypothetical protein